MNTLSKLSKLFFTCTVVSMLLISCGAPSSTSTPEVPSKNLVIILVVDNFLKIQAPQVTATPTLTEDNQVTSTPAPVNRENCAMLPDGQGYTGRESATAILDKPHGIFVYNDLIHEIENSTADNAVTVSRIAEDGANFTGTDMQFSDQSQLSWIVRYDLYEYPGQRLLVVGVDTDGLNLNSIEANIRKSLDKMSANSILLGDISLPPTTKFVVNMSFVLIPCDPLGVLGIDVEAERASYDEHGDRYDAVNKIPPLANLRTRLENLYAEEGLQKVAESLVAYNININPGSILSQDIESLIDEAVFQAYVVYLVYQPSTSSDWQDDGTFYSTLEDYFSNRGLEIVYVGAAGNFGASHPYAPASWDFVLSVSSEGSSSFPKCRQNIIEYSNCGEVKMDGAFGGTSHIMGTSFAVSKFSFWAARSLLGNDICPGNHTVLPPRLRDLNQLTATPSWTNFDYIGECQSQQ